MSEFKQCKKCEEVVDIENNKFFNDMCEPCQIEETDIEEEISNLLVETWNKFLQLKPSHPSDMEDFNKGIHDLQKVIGMRELRRLMPEKYPTKNID